MWSRSFGLSIVTEASGRDSIIVQRRTSNNERMGLDIPRFFAVPFCNILGESVLKSFTTALSFLTTKDTKVTKIEE